jgi:hypothetical protein
MKKLRTLMLTQLEHKPNGPFITGEDMVSFLTGKEIPQGSTAYLLEGHICRTEKEAIELYNQLHRDDILD